MRFNLGPFRARHYTGSNWSHLEIGFATGTKAGGAERFTGITGGFRSDHLLEAFGDENTQDVCTVNGRTYHGRIVQGVDGEDHILTALEVAARAQHAETKRNISKRANKAAIDIAPVPDAPAQDASTPEPVAA
jgi:hypothetical protein